MAREASRGSFLSATFSLLPCVAPAEFYADFVQPRFQCAVEFAIRGGQGVGQLLDAASAKNTEVMAGFASTQATDKVVIGVPCCLAIS